MICGDFNAVLLPDDRLFGNPITFPEIRDFSECIKQVQLTEFKWSGDYYTWSNKQASTDRIWSRLDRAFGNHDWMLQWGHVVLEYDVPHISDHAPMILSLNTMIHPGKSPFRFFNKWADHTTFIDIVQQVWSKELSLNGMENIWLKLKALKPQLKKLNREEFKEINLKIAKARQELAIIQRQLTIHSSDDLYRLEKKAVQNLEKWSLIEESALRQKSRAQWIKLGDANTKYFSAVIKERSQKKHLGGIQSLSGRKLTDPIEIKDEILLFYKSLMGTSSSTLPAVNRTVMKQGPLLSHQQKIQLCSDITDQEISDALKSIDGDKAPGIDGYNAHFFQKTWYILKDDIVQATEEFFQTGKLYRPINCTAITLIPKNASPLM
ncbi:hypothetical protein KY285_000579 [Solanum tuberosum]|nr:hypothetical protein KY285_000579 [Solanum tuberosum]